MQTRKRKTKSSTVMVAGMLAAWVSAIPVFAVDIIDDPVQIDERAAQVIQASNSLCWEINRFYQQQPDYPESYREAKEIWSQAEQLRDALRSGPVETEVLKQKVTEMNALFTQVEKSSSKWGPGDRSLAATNSARTQRTVVTPGVEVDIPFVGVRVGRPQTVVTEVSPPQLQRRRLHANSRGSKRSLERELAALNVALSYLSEDAGVTIRPNSSETGPLPQPPTPGSGLEDRQKVAPPASKTRDTESIPK